MKSTVSKYDFERAFTSMGRGDSFSYEGRNALYDYLIELEESTREEIELDVIALDCEYCEYKTALEAAQEYGYEEGEEEALDWLRDRTTVITFDSGIIIEAF